MARQVLFGICLFGLGVVLFGGCSLIHRSACGWDITLTGGHPSQGCEALIYGANAAHPLSLATPNIEKAGFSLQLPQYKHWYVVRNATTGIAIAKTGKRKDESYVIFAHSSKLPDLATPQAFQQFVDQKRVEDTNPNRFTILSEDEKLFDYGSHNALCLRYETTAIDHHAHTEKSENEVMHMTNQGLVCRSPYDPHVGISVIYSYRYRPKDVDETLSSKFDQLISTLQFEPIPQTAKHT